MLSLAAILLIASPKEPSALLLPLLPGQKSFVFTMYGAPGNAEELSSLVQFMQDRHLGNGFDPGPTPRENQKPLFDVLAKSGWPTMCYPGYSDMQVMGGRCVLTPADASSLAGMDRAGAFSAVQLGEWGYYFHNLSMNEPFWRSVYGSDFDKYRHLMKPAGLAGYDVKPSSRQECYGILEAYFKSRSKDLLNRVISVTGHSQYEAYAGEWGAKVIGLEVGENIAFTQTKLAFARGAGRQWRVPFSVQVSPWFSGACTTNGPLRQEGGYARGLDAGHSLSFYERMWLHGWFSGAAMVTPENSSVSFFERFSPPWNLTSHGQKAAETFQFMQGHDRGVPVTPVAIVLDHYAGYNAYMDKPWGILEPTAGDRSTRDLFDFQLFPGSDHIHQPPDPVNPEASYLRPTPYGEMFDVQLSNVRSSLLLSYPVIVLVGDFTFDNDFESKLESALRHGCRVLVSPGQREALAHWPRLSRFSELKVLEPWTNPATGRPAAISNTRLASLCALLPISVSGDPIEYQVNKTRRGFAIELINNAGVVKRPDRPAVTDTTAVAQVALKARFRFRFAEDWRSGARLPVGKQLSLNVGPGESRFIEFVR